MSSKEHKSQNINTAEKAHEEIFEMTVQEAILQIALDVCAESVRTIQDSEPLDIANAILSEVVNGILPEIAFDCIEAVKTESLKEIDPVPSQEDEAVEALNTETLEEICPSFTFQQELSFCSPFSPILTLCLISLTLLCAQGTCLASRNLRL